MDALSNPGFLYFGLINIVLISSQSRHFNLSGIPNCLTNLYL